MTKSRLPSNAGDRVGSGRPGAVWALLANVAAVVPLLVAYSLHEANREAYYRVVQEDEMLEWATVWAFAIAAVLFAVAAARQRRVAGVVPWFLAGVSLFCIFVAGEEISWGQRLFGFRPPAYFLQENFQQELNVHNVVDTSLRKLSLKAIILGYGVLLPLAALVPAIGRTLRRIVVVAPPLSLAPAFVIAFLTYDSYPMKFTGETVELILGLAFLFAALVPAFADGAGGGRGRHLGRLGVAVLLVVALGFTAAAFSRRQRSSDPAIAEAVAQETAALKSDFRALARRSAGRRATKCGLHKRLFSFVEKYDTEYLLEGAFAGLAAEGMPEQRAPVLSRSLELALLGSGPMLPQPEPSRHLRLLLRPQPEAGLHRVGTGW